MKKLKLLILCLILIPVSARATWQINGNFVGGLTGDDSSPAAVTDGSGGAFVAWRDTRNGSDIYLQRIDPSGNILWATDGVGVCTQAAYQSSPTLLPDGAGGVFVAWTDERSGVGVDIYAQRVDANGVALWNADGNAITTANSAQYGQRMTSDDSGGVFMVWSDFRAGFPGEVYGARITSNGTVLDPNGIWISRGAGGNATVAQFGSGYLVAWTRTDATNNPNVYAGRVSSTGVVIDLTPIALCTATLDQMSPNIVDDGAGGAIIGWGDRRSPGIYAQRLDSFGTPLWGTNGIPVGTVGSGNIYQQPCMLPDGAGGAIIAWTDAPVGNDENIYAQRINSAGARQWLPNDVVVCGQPNEQGAPVMCSDGSGGALIAWMDRRPNQGVYQIYAQRLGPTGINLYVVNGIPICTAPDNKWFPAIAPNGIGGAICTWTDDRDGIQFQKTYAMLVGTNGLSGVRETPAAFVTRAWPNPFSASTSIGVQLNQSSDVSIDVYDVAGRHVRSIERRSLRAGWHNYAFDGLNDIGQPLTSGVYFARIEAGGAIHTQKLTIVR